MQVTVPKGSLCNLNVKVNVGLPPDAVYNIVTDPENKRVFKNIQVICFYRLQRSTTPMMCSDSFNYEIF